VGSNCLLQLPSSMKQTKIDAKTIMNVILIKSIENTYVASILKEKNLEMKVNSLLLFVILRVSFLLTFGTINLKNVHPTYQMYF